MHNIQKVLDFMNNDDGAVIRDNIMSLQGIERDRYMKELYEMFPVNVKNLLDKNSRRNCMRILLYILSVYGYSYNSSYTRPLIHNITSQDCTLLINIMMFCNNNDLEVISSLFFLSTCKSINENREFFDTIYDCNVWNLMVNSQEYLRDFLYHSSLSLKLKNGKIQKEEFDEFAPILEMCS